MEAQIQFSTRVYMYSFQDKIYCDCLIELFLIMLTQTPPLPIEVLVKYIHVLFIAIILQAIRKHVYIYITHVLKQ